MSPESAFGSCNLEFHDINRLTNIHDKHGNSVMNYCTIPSSKTAEGFWCHEHFFCTHLFSFPMRLYATFYFVNFCLLLSLFVFCPVCCLVVSLWSFALTHQADGWFLLKERSSHKHLLVTNHQILHCRIFT